MKKPSKRSLVKKLDKVFSLFIRRRDAIRFNGMCPFCQKKPIECNFHFITRSRYNTRFDEVNCVASCFGCNYRMTFDQGPFIQWFLGRLGMEEYNNLVNRSRQLAKFSIFDLQEMIGRYQGKFEAMG